MTSSYYPSKLIISDFTKTEDISIYTVKNYFDYFGIADIDVENTVLRDDVLEVPITNWFDNVYVKTMIQTISDNGFDIIYYTPENYFIVAFNYDKTPIHATDNNDNGEYRADAVKHDNDTSEFGEFIDDSSDYPYSSLVSCVADMKITMDEQVSEMEKLKDYIAEAHQHILYLNKKNTRLTQSVSLLKRAITNNHIQKRSIAKSTWNRRLRVLK